MDEIDKINLSDLVEVYDEKLGFSKLYTGDGVNLLILIAPNYGATWSSLAGRKQKQLMMDSRIIRFFLETYDLNSKDSRDEEPMRLFLETLGIDIYLGGLHDLEIELVPKGMKFTVVEYDGAESVETFNENNWVTA